MEDELMYLYVNGKEIFFDNEDVYENLKNDIANVLSEKSNKPVRASHPEGLIEINVETIMNGQYILGKEPDSLLPGK